MVKQGVRKARTYIGKNGASIVKGSLDHSTYANLIVIAMKV